MTRNDRIILGAVVGLAVWAVMEMTDVNAWFASQGMRWMARWLGV